MLYFIIIVLFIALLISVAFIPYATIKLYFIDNLLTIELIFWFYKKKFKFDFSDKVSDDDQADTKKVDSNKHTDEKDFNVKAKFIEIKERIFNPETGFNIDEAHAIKNEFTQTYSQIIQIIKSFFSRMRHRICVPQLSITLDYGTDNPADTGMLYASFWSLIGMIYPLISRYAKIRYPAIDITPDFYEKRFSIKVKSIIKVRPAHIINASFFAFAKFGLTYLKNNFRKEREK